MGVYGCVLHASVRTGVYFHAGVCVHEGEWVFVCRCVRMKVCVRESVCVKVNVWAISCVCLRTGVCRCMCTQV